MPPRPALFPGRLENTEAGLEPKKARRGGLESLFDETRRPGSSAISLNYHRCLATTHPKRENSTQKLKTFASTAISIK